MPSKLKIAAATAASGVMHSRMRHEPDRKCQRTPVLQCVRALRDDPVASVRAGFAKLPSGAMRKGHARFDGPKRNS